MKRTIALLVAALLASLVFAAPAIAQDDPVVGTVVADPAQVPEAGEYTLTASGSGFIADTTILLGACVAPGDTLVPGVSTTEEITEAALEIDPLQHCDLDTALTVTIDADGNFSSEWTGSVGDNFFFSAGALDGSQAGAAYVPIVAAQEGGEDEAEPEPEAISEEGEEELADTAVNSDIAILVGVALLAAGTLTLGTARRRALD